MDRDLASVYLPFTPEEERVILDALVSYMVSAPSLSRDECERIATVAQAFRIKDVQGEAFDIEFRKALRFAREVAA